MKREGDFISKLKKIGLAKSFRKKPTEAEYKLWGFLRGKQLGGFKFRRQVPIGNYIVDFVCFSKKVIVELDGESHSRRLEQDKQRDMWFKEQSFEVLRFFNKEVMEEIEGVLNIILNKCNSCD